jgi:hypothetical protein
MNPRPGARESAPGRHRDGGHVIRWIVILSLLQVVPFWRIFGRMGLPPWLAIMASLPLVNLIVLYFVALTPWPRETAWKQPLSGPGPDAQF